MINKNIEFDVKFVGNIKISVPILIGSAPVIYQSTDSEDVFGWATEYKHEINEMLLKYGGILIRGFKLGSANSFNHLFTILCGTPMEYKNRSSPRELISNNIYTSTSHPPDQIIHMHTENSYASIFNRIIAFFCLLPPLSGGETPIADERKLMEYLGPGIVNKFKKLKVQYVRNLFDDVGLDWQTVYQTDDKAKVNEKLESEGVEYKWLSSSHLRTRTVMPAFQNHPITNQELWFNHMYFGHKSLYNPIVLEFFNVCDLPFSTYYGDGSEIEKEVIEKISDFYDKNTFLFKWQQDDFLLLDNLMFAHGRSSFKGNRQILTAMGQPFIRSQS